MADVTESQTQPHERPPSPASSVASTLSSNSEETHDWVRRQMTLCRPKYVEPLNIRIKIVTWNVNGKRVTEDLRSLLLETSEPGIYAIGFIIF
jgi:hypothetical protein